MNENSPAFQRWESGHAEASPGGTAEWRYEVSVVPAGLASLYGRTPSVETLGYFRMSLRDKGRETVAEPERVCSGSSCAPTRTCRQECRRSSRQADASGLILLVADRLTRFIPGLALAVLLLAGCAAPIGADRVGTRRAYEQVDANALRTGKPSANTVSILHRFDLEKLAARHADEAVRQLHQKALAIGDRDLLFGLAELSYVAGEQIRHSVKPWDHRDARDYYLGSAVYAWLFLFGESGGPPPGAYDRRFREACDFYNYSLGLALSGRKGTNDSLQLEGGRRALPVGEIELAISRSGFGSRLGHFEQILLADQFRVRGLSVRNREGGVGAPLICVNPVNPELGIRPSAPATALLRVPLTLAEVAAGKAACTLELYSPLDATTVSIAGKPVPLETDLTTYRAYTLNQSFVWSVGRMQFLSPGDGVRSQLILSQPYIPGRIPVVFVHGTFSSPVTWAEAMNSLTADPVLREIGRAHV